MGGCFHTGVALPLTPACSPSLLRSFLGQPLQGKASERRQNTGRGEAPVKHTQKEKAPKGRWNGSMSVIVPSLLRSFDGEDASMQGLRYRLPLPVFYRTYSALFCVVFYPRRCLGLTSYALCFASSSCQRTSFPLRSAQRTSFQCLPSHYRKLWYEGVKAMR